jgi:hypothetical protein
MIVFLARVCKLMLCKAEESAIRRGMFIDPTLVVGPSSVALSSEL